MVRVLVHRLEDLVLARGSKHNTMSQHLQSSLKSIKWRSRCLKYLHHSNSQTHTHWPVEGNVVPQFLLMYVAIQHIVADVGGGPFHALDEDLTLGDIEVVVHELPCVLRFPEEIFGNVSPKLYRGKNCIFKSTTIYNTHYMNLQKIFSELIRTLISY